MSFISEKGATGALALQANGAFQSSTDLNLQSLVGSRYDLSDGREVILVQVASAVSATVGHLMQDAAVVSGHQNATVGSFVAYSNNGNVPASAVLTLGASALTANQYAGGYLIVNSGTGIGQTLRIASNNAVAASSTLASIVLEDGPSVALAANDRVSLFPAHGLNVVDSTTALTNGPVGVALYNIPGGSFGFLCSKGIVSAISDASVAAAGYAIAPSITTAGTVTVATSTGSTLTSSVIGRALVAGVSAQAKAVFIDL